MHQFFSDFVRTCQRILFTAMWCTTVSQPTWTPIWSGWATLCLPTPWPASFCFLTAPLRPSSPLLLGPIFLASWIPGGVYTIIQFFLRVFLSHIMDFNLQACNQVWCLGEESAQPPIHRLPPALPLFQIRDSPCCLASIVISLWSQECVVFIRSFHRMYSCASVPKIQYFFLALKWSKSYKPFWWLVFMWFYPKSVYDFAPTFSLDLYFVLPCSYS